MTVDPGTAIIVSDGENNKSSDIYPKEYVKDNIRIYHPAGDVLWVFVEPGNVVP